jgi:predicted Zn-dependent peptidase
MPASDSSTTRSLTLSNGLRIMLCSAPRLKRCAAALRVAAGSHDVPEQWPGLAHFLEHLFFLGTARFPADENLMAYVQRHGGQVNASTRERTTDFFFELAPAPFAGGLDRLCEMLAHPRMSVADQLREREVLHAEFIAWSRDEASRAQVKRLLPISPKHPLRGFHAGNRFSLPVPRPAFQQALRHFYEKFYQAGQMTLSLAGPQSLDELQELATTFGGLFTAGSRIAQQKPPTLMDEFSAQRAQTDLRQMHLMFACEALPQGHQQAAAFFCTWLNSPQPGGLVAHLRDHGLIESLKAEVMYEFGGQVLLGIDIGLKSAIASKLSATRGTPSPVGASLLATPSHRTAQISSLIFNWLAFFKTHYTPLLAEYALLEQRRLAVGSALSLARHFSAETVSVDQAVCALDALLGQLTPQSLLQPPSAMPVCETIGWHLPEPNPFLRVASVPAHPLAPPPSFTFSDSLPVSGEANVYLRWTLHSAQPMLALMLSDSLKTLTADALQAGVALTFSAYGSHWQLKLTGLADPMPDVLGHALKLLSQPAPQTLLRYGQADPEPALIPIRELLKTLPDHFLNSPAGVETNELQRVWAEARWMGFATGLGEQTQHTLTHAMQAVPGNPDPDPLRLPAQTPGPRWQTQASESSENAVLVFYPAPSPPIENEAIWRLFAHLVQAPFYQRLRVDMQLGYAVFSGFRQIAGHSGMLFGVQSPTASVGQLFEHIETFMSTLPGLIENTDLSAQITALGDQLDLNSMDSQSAGEMLWQAHLAGYRADYPASLQHSFAQLQRDRLLLVARRVALPGAARLYLSNRSSPSGSPRERA